MAKLNILAAALVMVMLVLAAVDARPLYRKTHSRLRPWNILGRLRPWNVLGLGRTADAKLSVSGLDYYVQVAVGEPDLQQLIAPINTTTSNNFGSTQLFAFNVTEGADPTSTQLGYVRGYTVEASYTTASAGVEVEIISYNDGTLNGTVSIQGLIPGTGLSEVAIVGGTGDFRGVSGYGIISFVNVTDNIVLFHHELYFL